jgi:TP901 family phage tail tape measure protein
MSATLTIAALLTLKDQFSAPLRGAQNALSGLQERLKGVQGVAQRAAAALRGVSDVTSRWATTSAQIAAAGQFATGFGLESYIRNTIGVEHRLAALGNTASMSAVELKALDARLTAASRATNQFKADLLTANEELIAAGLEWQKALDITPVLGKVATATQASMSDLAQTAYALTSNLKVPVDQMQAAFERLTVAGQSGQFELKDMAREFAKLGASMGALKFTGLENVSRLGAALQIARRGAGDASEAANNLQNFLAKLAAPEVQKNFKKFGIDLPRLLKGARERGLDPFLVTLKAIQKATGGNEFKLGELFGDMQVQNFIKPMLLYTEDYKRLVGEINVANGVIEGNFRRMMNTTAERWKQFRIQLESTPMPWLDDLIGKLSRLLAMMNESPKIASAIAAALVGIAGAAIVLKTASTALSGLAWLIGLGGKIGGLLKGRGAGSMTTGGVVGSTLSGMAGVQKVWVVNMPSGGLGDTLPDLGSAASKGTAEKAGQAARTLGSRIRSIIAGGWMQLTLAWQKLASWGGKLIGIAGSVGSAIASAAGVAGRAILWLGRAVLLNPIGLILTSIAAAAYLIWRNWDTIGPKLAAVWQAVKEAFVSAWEWISALPGKMLTIGGQIIDGLLAGLRARWEALKETVSSIASGIADSARSALGIRSPSRVFAEIGGNLMGGLQLGIERAASLPLAAMRGVASALAAPITAGAIAFAPLAQAVEPVVLPEPADAVRTIRQVVEPVFLPQPEDALRIIRQTVEPIALPQPTDAMRTIRQSVESIALPQPDDATRTIRQAVEPVELPQPADALRAIRQTVEPIELPQPIDALRTIQQVVEPIELPQPADTLRTIRQVTEPSQTIALPSQASSMPGAASSPAPIQITVNLNGLASHEAAQDVAAAVRREVERVLAEQARRDALARRARLIDGGIA